MILKYKQHNWGSNHKLVTFWSFSSSLLCINKTLFYVICKVLYNLIGGDSFFCYFVPLCLEGFPLLRIFSLAVLNWWENLPFYYLTLSLRGEMREVKAPEIVNSFFRWVICQFGRFWALDRLFCHMINTYEDKIVFNMYLC